MRGSVLVSLCTIPSRYDAARKVVQAIGDQLQIQDRLCIHFNGHRAPGWALDHPGHDFTWTQTAENLGDAAKFPPGLIKHDYHITVDDDLNYPADFVSTMVDACIAANEQPVSCHGVKLLVPFNDYYGNRQVDHFASHVPKAKQVDILGTGSLCYAPYRLALEASDFGDFPRDSNMADIWFAIATRKAGLDLTVMAHAENWLTQQEGHWNDSIFYHSARKDGSFMDSRRRQTEVVKKHWHLLQDWE